MHINAHATSTPLGDIAEGLMIHATLGAAADRVVVTSTKSMTGHLLGGAGALESIATVLAMHDRVVPPTINLDDRDPKVELDIATKPRDLPQGDIAALNNSFGFGGANVAVAFGSYSMTHCPTAPPGARQKPAKLPREQDPRNPNFRLAALFDEGTLELITPDDGSGMLAAVGKVAGTHVVAFCSDATVMGGAMGEVGCKVVVHAYQRALADQAPIVGLWHSGGARLAEGVLSLHAVGEIFHAMTQASGKVPQISVVLGPAAGGAAYGPALTDLVILGPEGRIFVTGPDVVRSVTGEDVDMLRLGGPEPHGRRSGVVHILTDSEQEAIDRARGVASLLGAQGTLDVDAVEDVDLSQMLPESKKRAYDVHPLVEAILDEGTAQEVHAKWAPNIVTALGRFGGRTRRRDREQPAAPRRLPGLAVGGEGVPLRADVRRVRGAAGRRRRRARLPARCRPGVGRRRTTRRQAAARLR